MATRLYLSNRVESLSVSPDSEWDKATGYVVRNALAEPQGNGSTSPTITDTGTSGDDTLVGQFISPPLSGDQTISGTVKGQMRMREANADADSRAQIVIRVVSGDGSTVRGTLYAGDTATLSSEFATSLTNRKVPRGGSTSLSSVNALDGDVIVIEIGARRHVTGTARGQQIDARDTIGGTDLAEDETTTAANNPWIEFSTDLTFAGSGQRVSAVAVEPLYQLPAPNLRASAVAVEPLYQLPAPNLRASAVAVEVLRSNVYQATYAQADGSSSGLLLLAVGGVQTQVVWMD